MVTDKTTTLNIPRGDIDEALGKIVHATFDAIKAPEFSELNQKISAEAVEQVSKILTQGNPRLTRPPKVIVTTTTVQTPEAEKSNDVVQSSIAAKISSRSDGILTLHYKDIPNFDVLLTVVFITE